MIQGYDPPPAAFHSSLEVLVAPASQSPVQRLRSFDLGIAAGPVTLLDLALQRSDQ